MDFVNIQSASNPLLKRVRSLNSRSGRNKTGLFLAEGESVLEEALNTPDLQVVELIVAFKYGDGDKDKLTRMLENSRAQLLCDKVVIVEDRLFDELSTTESPTGLLAVLKTKEYELESVLSKKNCLLTLAHEVNDPGNLGTMFRTSRAFGADAMLLSKGSVDPYNPKVVRAAAGALFSLPFISGVDGHWLLEEARNRKIKTLALDADGRQSIQETDLTGPVILVMGNEARGLPESMVEGSQARVKIPMEPSTESLNLSIAHAITLFEAYKQRSSGSNLDRINAGKKKASE